MRTTPTPQSSLSRASLTGLVLFLGSILTNVIPDIWGIPLANLKPYFWLVCLAGLALTIAGFVLQDTVQAKRPVGATNIRVVICVLLLIVLVLIVGQGQGILTGGIHYLLQVAPYTRDVLACILVSSCVSVCAFALSIWGSRKRLLARQYVVVSALLAFVQMSTGSLLYYDSVRDDERIKTRLASTDPVLVVAVADFGQGSSVAHSEAGSELARVLYDSLSGVVTTTQELTSRVSIISAPAVRSQAEARRVARKIGARLIIWGWRSSDGTFFVPSFTFAQSSSVSDELYDMPSWQGATIDSREQLPFSILTSKTSSLIEYIVGLMYFERRDFEEAKRAFGKAVADTEQKMSDTGDDPWIGRTLAIYHLALERVLEVQAGVQAGRAECEKAMNSDPDYGPAYLCLGNAALDAKECERALEYYEQGIERASGHSALQFGKGNALMCLGEREQAASAYEKAIALNRDTSADPPAEYYIALGQAYCLAGHVAEGKSAYDSAEQLSKDRGPLVDALKERCVPPGTPLVEGTRTALTQELVSVSSQIPQPSDQESPGESGEPTANAMPERDEVVDAPQPLLPADGRDAELMQRFDWDWNWALSNDERFDFRIFDAIGKVRVAQPTKDRRLVFQMNGLDYGNYLWTVRVIELGPEDTVLRVVSYESKPRLLVWDEKRPKATMSEASTASDNGTGGGPDSRDGSQPITDTLPIGTTVVPTPTRTAGADGTATPSAPSSIATTVASTPSSTDTPVPGTASSEVTPVPTAPSSAETSVPSTPSSADTPVPSAPPSVDTSVPNAATSSP